VIPGEGGVSLVEDLFYRRGSRIAVEAGPVAATRPIATRLADVGFNKPSSNTPIYPGGADCKPARALKVVQQLSVMGMLAPVRLDCIKSRDQGTRDEPLLSKVDEGKRTRRDRDLRGLQICCSSPDALFELLGQPYFCRVRGERFELAQQAIAVRPNKLWTRLIHRPKGQALKDFRLSLLGSFRKVLYEVGGRGHGARPLNDLLDLPDLDDLHWLAAEDHINGCLESVEEVSNGGFILIVLML